MADKRRNKKKFQEEPEKPTKEEYAVAKYMRFNVPTKEAKLMSLPVQCFVASKAIDCLLDSKWAVNKGKTEALFTTRSSCVEYCNRLLSKGIFHRAYKQEKSKSDKSKKKSKKEETSEKKDEKSEKTKEKKSKKKEEKKEEDKDIKEESKEEKKSDEDTKDIDKKTEKKDEEKKKKRKYKLEMHDIQKFVDGEDIYVWIYDPVPLKNKIIGLFLVLGAIAVCLFPLWPPEVRLGVYYLSLAAAGFVGFILVLCVVRVIVFGIVWGVTFGKHHLWIFPNLTEDVGIIDSFKPFYHHEVVKKDDDKEDKNSTEKNSEKDENSAVDDKNGSGSEAGDSGEKLQDGEKKGGSGTEEGDSANSDSNGYEIVDPDEVEVNEN